LGLMRNLKAITKKKYRITCGEGISNFWIYRKTS
jgi:hypothetical protein